MKRVMKIKKSAVSLAMAAIMLTGTFGTPVMASEVDYALKDAKFDNVELKLYMNQNTTTLEYGGARCLDYIEAGTLLNLQPYLEADEEWYGNIMESCWEPAHFEDYGYEGLYCIPYSNYQVVLYYNKDILEENNVEVPTTWDELLAACETLKGNGVQPFIVGEKDNFRFGHLHTILSLKAYGADIGKKLGNREVA